MKIYSKVQLSIILTIVLTTVTFIPANMDVFILPKLFFLVLGSGILISFISLKFNYFWKSEYRAAIICQIIFLIAIFLTSIFSRQSFFATMLGSYGRNNGSLFYISLSIIFISVVLFGTLQFYKNILITLSFLGSILTIYGFFQILGADFINWELFKNEAILTFGNPNFSSVFLAFSLLATFSLALLNNKNLRTFYLFCFIAQAYLISLSTSFQGKVIFIFCLALLIGLTLQSSINSIIRKVGLIWLGTVLTGITMFTGALFSLGPAANFLDGRLGSFKDRTYHWLAAWEMFKSRPIFGVGIDSFRDYYRIFRSEQAIQFRGSSDSWTSNAHNLFFQFAATGGLILLIGYLSLLFFVIYRYFVIIRAVENGNSKVMVNIFFTLWSAYQLQSLISIDMPALGLWGWVFTGVLVGISYNLEKFENNSNFSRGYAPVNFDKIGKFNYLKLKSTKIFYVALVIACTPSIFIFSQLYKEYDYKQTRQNLMAASSVEKIQDLGVDLYDKSLRLRQPELRLDAIVKLLELNLKDQALRLAQQTTTDFPKSFGAWNALASIYEESNEFSAAIPARRRSIKLDPLNNNLLKILEQDISQVKLTST